MRSTTARRRIPTVATQAAVLAAAGALALTACSGNGSTNTSLGGSSSSGSNSSSAASSTGGSGSSGATGTGTASRGTAAASHGIRPCTTAQLKVVQADSGVGAGQYYSKLVFTNVSGAGCTLDGYPGVSYVKAGGVQSGNPAVRTGERAASVTLRAHGGTASAVLHDSNGIGGYDPGQCQLTSAEGLRVYPPNQKAALFIPWKTQHCAGLSIHPLTIGPVTP